MSLILTLTGTGGAQGVPAWGCECAACARARRSPQYRRQPCSGVVKFNDAITLIDAGLHEWCNDLDTVSTVSSVKL